jgi:simple sugar transport system permease protein
MKRITVPFVFVVLAILGWHYSQLSLSFITNEVLIRFIRDGILVLALIIPIKAGMGLNFAITIGAIAAQIGWLFVLDIQMKGFAGIISAAAFGCGLSIILGWLIGKMLNRVKGKEMITTMIMGFIGTSVYQFIFLVGYGTFIPSHNKEIILSRGAGVRSMVDLHEYRNIIDKYWMLQIGSLEIPLFMILVVIGFSILIYYILNTRIGCHIKAVGQDSGKAELLGINIDPVRIKAVVISTVTACLGQIVYLQNIGMMNVYTGHLNSDIFSMAALLAGGATVKNASVYNALLGIILFHFLFIVSPQAGQNLFRNAALGEYFRTFIAYGTIVFALMANTRSIKS